MASSRANVPATAAPSLPARAAVLVDRGPEQAVLRIGRAMLEAGSAQGSPARLLKMKLSKINQVSQQGKRWRTVKLILC
jgi:hypothetical protein